MDILEFALEKERLSREYYYDLAQKTDNVGLHNIIMMLVEQESEHCRVIEQLKAHTNPQMRNTDVLNDAKMFFEKIKESSENFDFNTTELELYRDARAKELKSREFYLEKAQEVHSHAQVELFQKLAQEEHKHYLLLDNICEFVAEPECYLENAEFVHIDNYPV